MWKLFKILTIGDKTYVDVNSPEEGDYNVSYGAIQPATTKKVKTKTITDMENNNKKQTEMENNNKKQTGMEQQIKELITFFKENDVEVVIRDKGITNSFVSSETKKQRVFIYAQDSDEQIIKDLIKAKGDYIIKTKRETALNRPFIRMIEELIK
jgi:hypothetical protein